MAGAGRPPRRNPRLSQHFLRANGLAASLVREASLEPDDLVIDIGAGRGALTGALRARAGHVVAVELDPALCGRLRARFRADPRVAVYQGDFFGFPLPTRPYRVVANLPFARSGAMVRRLVEADAPPEEAWLVLQREAAERFAGRPRRAETLRSLELKPDWHVEVVRGLRPADFDPPPAVACAVLWLARRTRPLIARSQRALWRDFAAAALTSGAPTVRLATRALFGRRELRRLAEELRFDAADPPATLHFDQWLGLFRQLGRASDHAREALRGAARRVARRPGY